MTDNSHKNEIQRFRYMINNLCEAKLFFFERQVSLFLSEFAQSPLYMDILTECNRDFYFDAAKEKMESDGVLPAEPTTLVALVIGYLVKIDTQQMRITEVLGILFPDIAHPTDSFSLFIDRILRPMCDAFCMLIGEPPKQDEQQIATEKLADEANEILQKMVDVALTTEFLDEKATKEIVALAKGFGASLEGELQTQKLLWLGLKNALARYRVIFTEMTELEKLFSLYCVNMEL